MSTKEDDNGNEFKKPKFDKDKDQWKKARR